MVQLLGQLARGAQVDIEFLDHMDGEANGTGLVHDRPFDGLADPPGGVGGEAEAALGIELFHRADQAQVALFNQVQQGQATVDIAPGNFHHQAQVALDHPPPGSLITLDRQTGVVLLLVGGQQG